MTLIKYNNYSREDLHNIYSPTSKYSPGAGIWGVRGIIRIPNTDKDFVFFITKGAKEAGHQFKEGITADGILTWQSQPAQKLQHELIKTLISHNEKANNIYLMFRSNSSSNYTYLGNLKYFRHDSKKEKPVHFKWQVLDWNLDYDLFDEIGLKLQVASIDEENDDLVFNILKKNQLIESKNLPITRKPNNPISRLGNKNPNYIELAKSNKKLGLSGELLVLEAENEKLKTYGFDKIAKHISLDDDSKGFDILSYDKDQNEIYIEVKTTAKGLNAPFFISPNELEVSKNLKSSYFIYRLYNYDKDLNSAIFYKICGDVNSSLNLKPTEYLATFRDSNNDD